MTDFVKWLNAQDPEVIRDPFSAAAGWAAGQRAERERIKKIIYEATDGGRGNYKLLIERISE